MANTICFILVPNSVLSCFDLLWIWPLFPSTPKNTSTALIVRCELTLFYDSASLSCLAKSVAFCLKHLLWTPPKLYGALYFIKCDSSWVVKLTISFPAICSTLSHFLILRFLWENEIWTGEGIGMWWTLGEYVWIQIFLAATLNTSFFNHDFSGCFSTYAITA